MNHPDRKRLLQTLRVFPTERLVSLATIYARCYECLEDQEYLLIRVTLVNMPSEELIEPYKHEPIDRFLNLILTQLEFKREEIDFDVRLANSRIEIFYTIKKDKILEFGDKKVHFQRGDQILTAISYRHQLEELKNSED